MFSSFFIGDGGLGSVQKLSAMLHPEMQVISPALDS